MTKKCTICKEDKNADPDNPKLSEFARDKSRRDGFQAKCKTCQKRLSGTHFQNNKQLYYDRNDARRVEIRLEVQQLKEQTPCADCGLFFPFYVTQFDHIGDDKIANISDLIAQRKTRERVFAEIAKCEVVCANCHAVRSYRRQYGLPLDTRQESEVT